MGNGIFQYLGKAITDAMNTYVNTTSSAMSSAIVPVVTVAVTIWVLLYGWATIRGAIQEPINEFAFKAVKISLILGIALAAGTYQSYVINTVNGVTNGLVSIVAPSGTTNVYSGLDQLNQQGFDLVQKYWERGSSKLPFDGWGDCIAALIAGACSAILLFIMGGYIILAQVAIDLILALGPPFIACLAFPPVARFFDSWLSKIVNYVLLMVLMAAISGFVMRVFGSYLTQIDGALSGANQIGEVFSLLVFCGAIVVVTLQAPQIAAGLGGGASLSGMGAGRAAVAGAVSGYAAGKVATAKGLSAVSSSMKGSGGSVQNTSGSSGEGQGSSRVPAYQQATQKWLSGRK